MDDSQDDYALNQTNRMPPLLLILLAVKQEYVVGIIPNSFRNLKRNAVLGLISGVFRRVPFKLHLQSCIDEFVIALG